jgi:hypothetical protein
MDWGRRVNASRTLLGFFCLWTALASAGCGSDEKQTPVHGRVYFHGRPLPGGTIVFTPDLERGGSGSVAYAEIDADGYYSLRGGEKLGVAAGWHRVTIAPPALAVKPGQAVPPPLVDLPRKYSDPHQSGLLRQVQPGKSAEQDFYLD